MISLKYLPEYECHVSSLGEVYDSQGVQLKQYKQTRGCLQVEFKMEGSRQKQLVHRLVAQAFLGLEKDQVVSHKDLDQTNNNVENLLVHSRSKAHSNACARGTVKPPRVCTLLSDEVVKIREASPAGAARKLVAGHHGVCLSTIHKVMSRTSWKKI